MRKENVLAFKSRRISSRERARLFGCQRRISGSRSAFSLSRHCQWHREFHQLPLTPSLPLSPSLLGPIVRAHCDLNGCLDRSEGNKMFARLLTPHGATAAATDIFKSLDATAEAAAAQVGLENGFGQCDRTAAGGGCRGDTHGRRRGACGLGRC